MTLIWHAHGMKQRPVALTYDGSESAARALEVAVYLQAAQKSRLVVYLVADNQEKSRSAMS